ncbi:hypothetical protein MTBBW1_750009 [Desulfamplus magnetovallimortis]|uniref:Uncharacterized protein n=1 Tax=Desulfamplus magnetovallimortis TaxID=1246637 RepID=A0A1W1HJF1_9BACT|nr:hypothetical protein MTBBW1_750009 [Desulfamplus magnetovallimortis]
MIDYVSITPKYKNDSHFHGKRAWLPSSHPRIWKIVSISTLKVLYTFFYGDARKIRYVIPESVSWEMKDTTFWHPSYQLKSSLHFSKILNHD